MVNLDGKFIPIAYFKEYNGAVTPDEKNRITPSGEERPPKDFPFRATLDRFGHIYFIPLVEKLEPDGKTCLKLSYTINDIVEAASGSAAKRNKIYDVHAALRREYINCYVMSDEFVNAFWGVAKPTFIRDYVKVYGVEPVVPQEVTTYNSLSLEEAVELASKAQTSSET